MDYTKLLGEKTLNSSGHVIDARSVFSAWILEWDPEKKAEMPSSLTSYYIQLADIDTMDWELALIQTFKRAIGQLKEEADPKHNLVYYVPRGYL